MNDRLEADVVNVTRNPDTEYGCGCKSWFVVGISGQHVIWELCNKHFQIMQHMAGIESCDFERNKVNRGLSRVKINISEVEVKHDILEF